MAIGDVLGRLPALKKFSAGSPATDAEIADIERQLGVRLPAQYIDLLRQFGFVWWFGHAVYGIHRNDAEKAAGYDLDVVTQTQRARNERISPECQDIPTDVAVIGRYDAGGWYLLFAADSPRAGQVALFDHEVNGAEAQSWKSLEEFLLWLIG